MSASRAPRVEGNDWGILHTRPLGSWVPERSVSIVIPAFGSAHTLPYTLAALSAQTYPRELLEVIVVDDGSEPRLRLPDLRPERTQLMRVRNSWGSANARREGAHASGGEVIHWLDADMVPDRDEVEAHMRWHHELDHAVVLGHKTFVDAEDLPPVEEVLQAVRQDTLEEALSGRWTDDHGWLEELWCRTDDLKRAGFRSFHAHVGASASVGRELYLASGGLDPSLKMGEDVELGYRLQMKGGVFVADRSAHGWHLGRSTLMKHEEQVQRHNAPFMSDRVPDFRKLRQPRGRTYAVPLMEVVVDVGDHSYESVKYTVDGTLKGVPGDVQCVILGPWEDLPEERRRPLEDPRLDLRLIRAEYASDGRVTFAQNVPRTAFPAMFRLYLPVGWRPGRSTLDFLTKDTRRRALGLRSILLPDGRVARLERTAAFERALHIKEEGEDLDDVVDDVSATWWSDGVEDGFLHPQLAPEPRELPVEHSTNGTPVADMGLDAPTPRPGDRPRTAGVRVGLRRIGGAMRRAVRSHH